MRSSFQHSIHFLSITLLSLSCFACTDEGEDDMPSGGTGTTGGSGGASGGSGGASGGSGGAGGTGGAGGGVVCLAASVVAEHFEAPTSGCIEKVIDAPDFQISPYGVNPTWGRHAGLLTSRVEMGAPNDTLVLERWSVNGTMLAKTETSIPITPLPAGSFVGSQTIDLPGNRSLISWSGMMFLTQGGFVVTKDNAEEGTFDAIGATGLTAGPLSGGNTFSIFYTGLSQVDAITPTSTALYEAKFDGPTLTSSASVSAWGNANGPVTRTADDHVVAINTDSGASTQAMRSFVGATTTEVATLPGFGDALAATTIDGAKPGKAFFQPNVIDAEHAFGAYRDVVSLTYAAAASSPVVFLALKEVDTRVVLVVDDENKLWVGAAKKNGTGSVFYVMSDL